MGKKTTPLPPAIYVRWDGDYPDMFLNADTSADAADDGDVVGVYELRETKTKHITHELK